MDLNWGELLLKGGDPVEQNGCKNYHLHEKFSRYCEFWGRYVVPNRDPGDPSKLRPDIPVELEDLFNHHYGVFYHLVIAHRQIDQIQNPDSAVDIGDPLSHLSTAIDLTERVFVMAAQMQNGDDEFVTQLSDEEFYKKVCDFWKEQYSKDFGKWKRRYKPVSIRLHDLNYLFRKHVPDDENREAFVEIAQKVREYRNALIHNLPPLRIVHKESGQILIPKKKHLNRYADGRWSSARKPDKQEHYELAHEIIQELANGLVEYSNNLWISLLNTMQDPKQIPKYLEKWLQSSGIVMSKGKFLYHGIEFNELPYDGLESGEYPDDQEFDPYKHIPPPTKPSGIW